MRLQALHDMCIQQHCTGQESQTKGTYTQRNAERFRRFLDQNSSPINNRGITCKQRGLSPPMPAAQDSFHKHIHRLRWRKSMTW